MNSFINKQPKPERPRLLLIIIDRKKNIFNKSLFKNEKLSLFISFNRVFIR